MYTSDFVYRIEGRQPQNDDESLMSREKVYLLGSEPGGRFKIPADCLLLRSDLDFFIILSFLRLLDIWIELPSI